jgi:SSS family transporter
MLAATGVLVSRRQSSTDDYFRGGGRIPMLAAAISFLATALSAATYIGAPQQSYAGDLSYLSANIGSIVAVLVVALFFIPAFFRHKVLTVYGLLADRFGVRAAAAASGTFLVGRIFADGARLYIAAIPASLIIFGDVARPHLMLGIAALTLVGVFYTYVGGIRAVIYTDVIQTVVFTGAALIAAALLLHRIPADLSTIIAVLKHPAADAPSKLTLLKPGLGGFGPGQTYTLLTAVFGFTLLNIGAYGTDQNMAQRALTCGSAVKGSWSTVTAVLVGLPVTATFMLIGLLLWVFYQRPDLMGAVAPAYQPESSRQVFLTFIIREMPAGLSGLMMAGLFAAALSTVNSAINSMASAFVGDFYRRFRPERTEVQYVRVGRFAVMGFGVLLALFAVASVFWQEARPQTTLIDFALQVMVFAYSGLVAVFITAIFTKRGSAASVVAALIAGFAAVALMQWKYAKVVAFPWQMFIATGLAFGVCLIGRRRASSA